MGIQSSCMMPRFLFSFLYSIQMKYKQCHDTTISLYMLHLLAIDLAYESLTLDKASNV